MGFHRIVAALKLFPKDTGKSLIEHAGTGWGSSGVCALVCAVWPSLSSQMLSIYSNCIAHHLHDPHPAACRPFTPLVTALPDASLPDAFSTVHTAVKRNRAAISAAVHIIETSASRLPSKAAQELVPGLGTALKGEDVERRAAVRGLETLGRHGDADLRQSVIDVLLRCLRAPIDTVVGSASLKVLGRLAGIADSDRVLPALSTAVHTNADAVRLGALDAVHAYVRCGAPMPAYLKKEMNNMLTDNAHRQFSAEVRISMLLTCAEMCELTAGVELVKSITDPMAKLAASGEQKVGIRPEAVAALAALATAGCKDDAVRERVTSRKLWHHTVRGFMSEITTAGTDPMAAKGAAVLFGILLSSYSDAIDKEKDQPLLQMAAILLGSPHRPARDIMRRQAVPALRKNTELRSAFYTAVQRLLDTYIESESGILPSEAFDRHYYAGVFAAAAPSELTPSVSDDGTEDYVPALWDLLRCAHHPAAADPDHPLTAWRQYISENSQHGIENRMLSNVDTLEERMCNDLVSSNAVDRRTAAYMSGTLAELCGGRIAKTVCHVLQPDTLLTIPDEHIAIYRTLEDQLYLDVSKDSLAAYTLDPDAKKVDPRQPAPEQWGDYVRWHVAKSKEEKDKSKKTGGKSKSGGKGGNKGGAKAKGGGNKGGGKKGGGKSGGGGRGGGSGNGGLTADAADRMLSDIRHEYEAAIRSRVDGILRSYRTALLALRTMFAHSTCRTVSYGVKAVIKLLKSDLLFEEASDTLRVLFSRVSDQLHPVQTLLLRATIRLYAGELDTSRTQFDNDHLLAEHTVSRVRWCLSGHTVDGESFACILPVLEVVLRGTEREYSPASRSIAMNIVHTHAGLESLRSGTVRPAVAQLLQYALVHCPQFSRQAHQALSAMGHHLHPEDLPAILQIVRSEHPRLRHGGFDALARYPLITARDPDTLPLEWRYSDPNNLMVHLWVGMHDPDEQCRTTATSAWNRAQLHETKNNIGKDMMNVLHTFLEDPAEPIRRAASRALAEAASQNHNIVPSTLGSLLGMFSGDTRAEEYGRLGAAYSLHAMGSVLAEMKQHDRIFAFAVKTGLRDESEHVREAVLDAMLEMIRHTPREQASPLLDNLEKRLSALPNKNKTDDYVVSGMVVTMGWLGQYADPQKAAQVAHRLIDGLKTPAEAVQRSVASVLSPLARHTEEQAASSLMEAVLTLLKRGKDFGERRGGAYGVAGMVRGLGLWAVPKYGVVEVVRSLIKGKSVVKREAGLSAVEVLSMELGTIFEPYVVFFMPMMLRGFGDSSPAVREATQFTAEVVMRGMSPHGVRMLLPLLTDNLSDDKQWRTREGAILAMGTMAHCAPRQLSTLLPSIVPRLRSGITDTHDNVAQAASTALERVGGAVGNPEIAPHVPVLQEALRDPEVTEKALNALLYTRYVHAVDAASLSLMVPVLTRGLTERSTSIKTKAAQIVGSMSSLIASPDVMLPYVPQLLPVLKHAILDPIPQVRAAASRALGTLVKSLGRQQLDELVPWLQKMLVSTEGSAERSGAAQALAELIGGQGVAEVDRILGDLLAGMQNGAAESRQGYLYVFVHLPSVLRDQFIPYIGVVLPRIVDALADEAELVRDAALRCGEAIVKHYTITSAKTIVGIVEAALGESSWRVRVSGTRLLGMILDTMLATAKEEGSGSTSVLAAATKLVGGADSHRLIAQLYLLRNDGETSVRSAATDIWKALVANTGRTLREVMRELISALVKGLCSEKRHARLTAGNAVSDLTERIGQRLIVEMMPVVSDGLTSEEPITRQGVMSGLGHIVEAAHSGSLSGYLPKILPVVQKGVGDSDSGVREESSNVYNLLVQMIGVQVIEQFVPGLVSRLQESEDTQAVLALKELLSVRPVEVLRLVVPKIFVNPLPEHYLRAIAEISPAAAPAWHMHFATIVPVLIQELGEPDDPLPSDSPAAAAAAAIGGSVSDRALKELVPQVFGSLEETRVWRRRGGARMLQCIARAAQEDVAPVADDMLRATVRLFGDPDDSVVEAAWSAAGAVTAALPKMELPRFLPTVRETIKSITEDERGRLLVSMLPAFARRKGLQPVLPMFLQALMHGTSSLREQAALGLGELIALTPDTALRPFVIQIAGPLIRNAGDPAFPWQVKAAILGSLHLLLGRSGMKPFAPQLQTTFVRSVADATPSIRSVAAAALKDLVSLTNRIDSLVSDLHNTLQTHQQSNEPVCISVLQALHGVVPAAAPRCQTATLTTLVDTLLSALPSFSHTSTRSAAAKALAVAAYHVASAKSESDGEGKGDSANDVLTRVWDSASMSEEDEAHSTEAALHGFTLLLGALLHHDNRSSSSAASADRAQAAPIITRRMKSRSSLVRTAAIKAAQALIWAAAPSSSPSSTKDQDASVRKEVETGLARIIVKDGDREVRVCGAGAVRTLARRAAGDAYGDGNGNGKGDGDASYDKNEVLRQELCDTLGVAVAVASKERYPPLRTMAEGTLAHLFGVHLMGTDSYLLATTLEKIDNSTEAAALRSACKRAGETYSEDMLADEDKDMDVDVDGAF